MAKNGVFCKHSKNGRKMAKNGKNGQKWPKMAKMPKTQKCAHCTPIVSRVITLHFLSPGWPVSDPPLKYIYTRMPIFLSIHIGKTVFSLFRRKTGVLGVIQHVCSGGASPKRQFWGVSCKTPKNGPKSGSQTHFAESGLPNRTLHFLHFFRPPFYGKVPIKCRAY